MYIDSASITGTSAVSGAGQIVYIGQSAIAAIAALSVNGRKLWEDDVPFAETWTLSPAAAETWTTSTPASGTWSTTSPASDIWTTTSPASEIWQQVN